MTRHRRALALATGAALLLAWRGAVLPGHMLLGHDATQLFLPLKQFLAEQLAQGRLPAWYPYDGLGVSFPGALVPGLLDPFNLLLAFLAPASAVRWTALLSDALAALGAYLWARAVGLRRGPAAFAGAAFALSGVLLSQTALSLQYVGGFSRAPLALWAAERLGRKPSAASAALLGLALASILWSGDPECLLVAALLSALAIARHRPAPARAAGAYALAGVLSLLLTGPVLLPAASSFGGSSRAAGLSADEALSWSLHPVRLLELALGSPFGLEHGQGAVAEQFGGHSQSFWSPSAFLGSLVVGLALWGALGPGRRATRRFYGALGLVLLWAALGSYGHLYAHLPAMMHFRYPEKLLVWPTLVASLFAGLGLQRLRGQAPSGRALLGWGALLGLAGLVGAHWLPGFVGLTARALLLLVAVASTGRVLSRRGRQALVAGLAAAELALANGGLVHHGPVAEYLPAQTPLPEAPEGTRVCSDMGFSGYTLPPERHDWDGLRRAEINVLAPGFTGIYRYRAVYGLIPAVPASLARLCAVEDACADVCARVLGARFGFVDVPEAPALLADGSRRRVRDLELPRATLLEDLRAPAHAELRPARAYDDEEQTLRDLHFGRLDPLAEARVPRAEAPGWEAYAYVGSGLAQEEPGPPDQVSVRTRAEKPALLLVHEAYSRDWQARIDGQPAPVWRAELGLLGVPVPAGEHRVELRFHPRGWPGAFAAWGLGLTACLLLLARGRRPAHAGAGRA